MKSLITILFLLLFSCSKRSYDIRGTILEVRRESQEFLIHHDEIPGFMMAMTMPFKLADSLDLNKYRVGDSLKFRLEINKETAFATNFQLLGKGTVQVIDSFWDDEYTAIETGEIFRDVTFLDIDGNAISLSDSDGKFRLISYIFTRCPIPNMCPAIVAKNQYLAETFSKTDKVEFILISFDYIYDTPSVMKTIYSSFITSYPNMQFYSSVGQLNDIFMLAGQSNVSFWGIDENDIGHTLRSILISPERRLMKAFEGIDWRPEAAERDINNILRAYNF